MISPPSTTRFSGLPNDRLRPRVRPVWSALGPGVTSAVVESEEVRPGVVLDFDARGRVVGMEMLRVKDSLPDADLRKVHLEVA